MTPTIQSREVAAQSIRARGRRLGSGAKNYVAGLQATLAITEHQMEPWTAFAQSLCANRRRMESEECAEDLPYGTLEDRLAALASMRHATAQLCGVLDTNQQRKALQLLPLCCLPREATRELGHAACD